MGRSRGGDKEEGERHSGLLKLVQILSFLVVFVAGIVIGLGTSAHINQYFNSQSQILHSFITNDASASLNPNPNLLQPENNNCTMSQQGGESYLSMEAFIQPKVLSHSMADDELLWRASLMPIKEGYPYRRVPKVAFMFLTRGPLPLLPLWERFFSGQERNQFSIYVHAPPGFKLDVSSSSVFHGREIPSQTVAWGTATLTDAERRLLANALLNFSNERFVLLSESCIPVYDFQTVYKYLTKSNQSFVESYDEPSRYGRGRFSRSMLPDIKLRDWRKGSQWFEVNRALAIYIVSDVKYYDLFKRYCKPACYPDEHYIPTYTNMFHGSLNSNRTVTWVDWSMLGPHPAMYGRSNITAEFIESIRLKGTRTTPCVHNSEMKPVCYLFARKFAPDTLEPLLNISLSVMAY